MDIELGVGMDGGEAARRILEQRSIPVVFLTAYSGQGALEKVSGINRYGYVLKNSGEYLLKSTIETALRLFNEQENLKISNIELRENEEKYHTTFVTSPDSISITTLEGVYVDINESYTRLTGFTREDIIGRSVSEIEIWAIKDQLVKLMKELRKSGFAENMESVFKCKDGTIKSSFISSRIIKINDKPHILSLTRDFTERNRALEALRKSEENLATAQARAHFGSWELNFSNNNVTWSDEMYRIFGVRPEGGPMVNIEQLELVIHPEDMELVKNNEYRIINEKQSFVSEYRIIRFNDKALRWLESMFEPLVDERGEVTGIFGTALDITERKLVVEALHKSEASLAAAQARSHLGSWEVDVIQRKMFWSDEMYRLLGIDPGTGNPSMDSFIRGIHPDERAKITRDAFQAITDHQQFKNEYRIVRPDGNVRWVESHGEPVFDSTGRLTQIVGTLLDITERKLADDALRESEEKFRSIAENISDVIFITDAGGIITYLSDSVINVFGYSPEEMEGHFFGEYLDEQELQRVFPLFQHAIQTGLPARNIDLIVKRKDNKTFNAELSSSLIKKGDKVTGSLGLIRDISDRKLVEEKIRNLLYEKELLLKEVHHRIKNNMSVMISLLSLQADNIKDPVASSALMDARTRMQSMGVLYDKLYRSENFTEMPIREYLSPLINEIVGMFPKRSIIAVEQNIEEFNLSYKLLSSIGIMTNEIITNTLKHAFVGRDNGVIKVTFFVKEKFATLIIEDNGIGMPESIDVKTSAGFGLQLVELLTQQIGGKIKIERNSGTRFIVEFAV